MKPLIIFAACILCSIGIYAQIPTWLPSSGLVGWYPFNGNAHDESSHNNNGIVTGATLTTDRLGTANSAYLFNGTSNYITVKDTPSIRVRNISIAAWIKPANTSVMQIAVKSRISDSYYETYFMNTMLQFGFKNYGNCVSSNLWRRVDYNASTVANTWQFVVSTYDGSVVKNYINGVLASSSTAYSGLIDSCVGSDLRFGYNWNTSPNYAFNGVMDDIAIYNRALTLCEIQQMYTRSSNTVTTQPVTQTIPNGSTASFSVVTAGSGVNYQWQQNIGTGFVNLSNAGVYSGATTSTLTITPVNTSLNNSVYRCIVSSAVVCNDTSDEAILKLNFTGVTTVSNNDELLITPNPSSAQVFIRHDAQLMGRDFVLTNQVGQLVMHGKLEQKTTELNIKDLSAGVYYFRLQGNEAAYKIVKY